jgi:hypothetical protein
VASSSRNLSSPYSRAIFKYVEHGRRVRCALNAHYETSRTGRAGYICAVAILDTVGIAARLLPDPEIGVVEISSF